MAMQLQRVRLEGGIRLNLNNLIRNGYVMPGDQRTRLIRWTWSHSDQSATGVITSDMVDNESGWLQIQMGSLTQKVWLTPVQRHYGGRQ